MIRAFEAYVDDLSNWYIRRSRRRFWDGDETALRVLWHALVQALRVIAPVMPFLAEHLWQVLVREPVRRRARERPSRRLAGGGRAPTTPCSRRSPTCGASWVSATRRARPPAARCSSRSARSSSRAPGCAAAHADEIRDELRVKDVRFDAVDAELRVKPNLPVLGPKLGPALGAVRSALQEGEFEELGGGRFRAAGHELGPDEVLVERAAKEGWAVAAEDGVTVALDTHVDEELDRERRVYELIRRVNALRKESGFALSDRIALTIPSSDADLLQHADWIKAETLAVSLDANGDDAAVIARA